jgi:hypothetical protein
MTDALLEAGWSYHERESARLADELEASVEGTRDAPASWADFLRLANHTIGEHLGDWPRARRLADAVLVGQTPKPETAKAWAHLFIARLLANDPVAAAQAELTLLKANGPDFRAASVETRFMLVAALVSGKRTAEAAALYAAALDLARGLGDAAPHRAVAVASNNLASELVEAPTRSREEDALMTEAAEAAHEFWRRCGTWVHDERALYLKALVASALGRWAEAIVHADAALAIIAANGDEPVDAAFLTLARSRAHRAVGSAAASAADLAAADAAAAGWDDDGLKAWYAEERAKAVS